MKNLDAASECIERAISLSDLLDASYNSFTLMLEVIEREQDRGGPLFAAFVMAGVPASSGRFALLTAPSFPASTRHTPPMVAGEAESAEQAADAIARLSLILAHRLDDEAATAVNADDRTACAEAARHAWALHARLR